MTRGSPDPPPRLVTFVTKKWLFFLKASLKKNKDRAKMEAATIQCSNNPDEVTKYQVVEFLNKHFLPHEPMNISIGLIEPGYRIPFFDAMVRRHLEEEDTLLVTARITETGEMVGLAVLIMERYHVCRMLAIDRFCNNIFSSIEDSIDKDSRKESKAICMDDDIPKKLKKIFDFIDYMKSHVDMTRDFHVDTWADVEFLACHSEKRIPGLGTELIARAVEKLQEMGVKVGNRS